MSGMFMGRLPILLLCLLLVGVLVLAGCGGPPPQEVAEDVEEADEPEEEEVLDDEEDPEEEEEAHEQGMIEFEGSLDLIRTFRMLEYRTPGARVRYEFVGNEVVDGEDTYRVKLRMTSLVGDDFELWIHATEGTTVRYLLDGKEPPATFDGLEHGNDLLRLLVSWLMNGVKEFRKLDVRDQWVSEDRTEMKEFGPTTAEVRILVLKHPIMPAWTYGVEYADLGDFHLMTRFSPLGNDVLVVTEFELH